MLTFALSIFSFHIAGTAIATSFIRVHSVWRNDSGAEQTTVQTYFGQTFPCSANRKLQFSRENIAINEWKNDERTNEWRVDFENVSHSSHTRKAKNKFDIFVWLYHAKWKWKILCYAKINICHGQLMASVDESRENYLLLLSMWKWERVLPEKLLF